MATFLDRMKLGGFAVEKAERYAGAFALGVARGREPGGATVDRVGTISGIAATVAGIALRDSLGASAAHVERLGDVLLQDRACCEGLRWGQQLAGRVIESRGGAKPKPKSIVGRGPFLTPEEIANYAKHR